MLNFVCLKNIAILISGLICKIPFILQKMLIQSCWNVLQAGNRMLHVAVPFRVQPQPSRPTFYLNAKGEFWIKALNHKN